MVSPALSQLLERARVRFGLEIEILDAALNNVYPEGGTDLSRIIQGSPSVRRSLLDAIAAGRTERLEGAGAQYRVYPLRQSAQRRQATGLLAIRRNPIEGGQPLDAEPWSDLARAIVETDLAAVDSLGDERQRSRRLVGVLRFIEHITETEDEASLALALMHAAAVWYDVDARVYRRDLTGNYVIATWLPGVQPDPESQILGSQIAGDDSEPRRLISAAEVGESAAGHDALVLPLTAGGAADWLLVVVGTVPTEADLTLRLIGRVAGARFASFAANRAEQARAEFEAALGDATRAPELVAVRLVHGLAQAVQASSGSLTLTRHGRSRRVAAVGQLGGGGQDLSEPSREDALLAPDRMTFVLPLGGSDYAVLELRASAGHDFSLDAAAVAQAAASVMRTWLAGTLASFDASAAALDVTAATVPAFALRIQEELDRAKRFDLRLSLILLNASASSDAIAQLEDALRRELRGSDVTGAMGSSQVGALLTHTDALGLDNVVRRLKQRLADEAERLNVSDLSLGQAAFSPEVRTADALLELALRQAEPVIVH